MEESNTKPYKSKRMRGPCVHCGKLTPSHKKGVEVRRCRPCSMKVRGLGKVDKFTYRREWTIKKKYGMDGDEFFAYWSANRGCCYLCERKMEMPKAGQQGQSLISCAVDHDHKTGRVRALLCARCNKALGFFEDDVELLKKAIKYLSISQ